MLHDNSEYAVYNYSNKESLELSLKASEEGHLIHSREFKLPLDILKECNWALKRFHNRSALATFNQCKEFLTPRIKEEFHDAVFNRLKKKLNLR